MPTITRIAGLHNQNEASNTDKVWAGLILHYESSNNHRFATIWGRRGQMLRAAFQDPTTRFEADRQFDRAQRDKLAHGYHGVDWTDPQYGMIAAIRQQGTFSSVIADYYDASVYDRSPNTAALHRERDAEAEAERQRIEDSDRRQRERAWLERLRQTPAPEREPDPEVLSRYIQRKTTGTEPDAQPAPQEAPKQPWIRKARRRF